MGRPKEFNPEEAMKEAIEAFWQRGYHATSVNDLLTEMKLNRGSLYGTFGDKKHLFLAALSEYERQGREVMRQELERPDPAREVIAQWVERAGQNCIGDAGQKGCLALKAAMEMAPQDADVAEWVRKVTRDREQLIARVVKRGQEEGQINPKLGPRVVARYLLSALAGLRVMALSAPTGREMSEVVGLVLRVLE